MNGTHDPEEIIGAWLDESPGALPETTRRAIATSIRTIRQRRHLLEVPWRPTDMTPTKLALIAAALVAAIGGAVFFLNRGGLNTSVGSHSPSPSVVASPTGSPSPTPTPVDTTGWKSFSSSRHGFSVSYPADWKAVPAIQPWNLEVDQDLFNKFHTSIDDLYTVSPKVMQFAAYGGPLPSGLTYPQFVETYRRPSVNSVGPDCIPVQANWEPIQIDGHDAGLYGGSGCPVIEAQVFYQGRIWIFSGLAELANNRPIFKAMLSTINLHPELADDTPVAGMPTWNPSASPGVSPSPN